jgi:hypothetical protein
LLIAITQAFDKSTLRIFDNKNNRVKSFSEPKWQNQEYYHDHFTTHDAVGQRKTLVVHRIMTKKTISGIKNDPNVSKHLKKLNTFLRGHFWKEDEVLLKDIGFLVSYIPTKHSTEFVNNDIFTRCSTTADIEWTDAPSYKLIHAQPKIKLAGKKQTMKTHAFSVQVLTKDASKMNQFLQKIYENDPLYMPYSMKEKLPKTVAQAILRQNKLLNDTWVIVLVGVPRDMMPDIFTHLRSTTGVIAISDTNRTDKAGRWHVLVQGDLFKPLRKLITTKLPVWFNATSTALREAIPLSFPSPNVFQKHKYKDDDDSSSGQASYMSSCAQSYGSLKDIDTDDTNYNPPGNKSYAAALLGTPVLSPTVTKIIVPDRANIGHTIQPSPDYPSVIAGLQADITIANLQAEVKSLRLQITGAQTPSTVTESSAPETAQTADRMALIEANMALLTSQFTTWMSEFRQSQTHDSPVGHRTKRTDTRDTPDRTDLMITNPTGKQLPGNNASIPQLEPPPPAEPLQEMEECFEDTIVDEVMPSHPYNVNRPQFLYVHNGNGSLDSAGYAGPNDFTSDGRILGPRPALHQPRNSHNIQAAQIRHIQVRPNQPGQPRQPPSPMDTIVTKETKTMPLSPQGPPSPLRIRDSNISPLPSLPAKGASPSNL